MAKISTYKEIKLLKSWCNEVFPQRRSGSSHYLRYNETVPLQNTKWSVRLKYLRRETQSLASSKLLVFSERPLNQQHAVRRQLLRKHNTKVNGSHKKNHFFFQKYENSISEKQTKNATISTKQAF